MHYAANVISTFIYEF